MCVLTGDESSGSYRCMVGSSFEDFTVHGKLMFFSLMFVHCILQLSSAVLSWPALWSTFGHTKNSD